MLAEDLTRHHGSSLHFLLDASTYFLSTPYGKGMVWVNGFNIGRYWPGAGPQLTLYIPEGVVQAGTNDFVLLELEQPAANLQVSLVQQPDLTGPTAFKGDAAAEWLANEMY